MCQRCAKVSGPDRVYLPGRAPHRASFRRTIHGVPRSLASRPTPTTPAPRPEQPARLALDTVRVAPPLLEEFALVQLPHHTATDLQKRTAVGRPLTNYEADHIAILSAELSRITKRLKTHSDRLGIPGDEIVAHRQPLEDGWTNQVGARVSDPG